LKVDGGQHKIDMSFSDDLVRVVRIIGTQDFYAIRGEVFGSPIKKFNFLIDDKNRLLGLRSCHALAIEKQIATNSHEKSENSLGQVVCRVCHPTFFRNSLLLLRS
jgi:hypothetical protein